MSKNVLNSRLFSDNVLKQDVLDGLRKIVDRFLNELKEANIPIDVLDCWLVGSNASFNYKPTSDIDLHIIANTSESSSDPNTLQILYNYFKSSFNDKYDITCKGLPVELYIEDINTGAVTNGIYSLFKNKWVKEPKVINAPNVDITKSDLYVQLMDAYNRLKDEDCEQFINDLYLLRKESLATDGEFGEGNLIFKKFRDDGLLDALKLRRDEYTSDDLTVEALKEAIRKYC